MARTFESSGLHSLAALRAEAEQAARTAAKREAARFEHERAQAAAAESARDAAHRAELDAAQAERSEALEKSVASLARQAELARAVEQERALRRSDELTATRRFLAQRLLSTVAATACLASWLLGAVLYFGVLRPRHERALNELHDDFERVLEERELSHLRDRARPEPAERSAAATPSTPAPQATGSHPAPARVVKSRGPATPPVKTPKPRCRDDGDPLNPCLKP